MRCKNNNNNKCLTKNLSYGRKEIERSRRTFDRSRTGYRSREKEKHDVIGAALTAMNGYNDYVIKHGSHFTDDLAKWASEQMTNAHGDPAHRWGVEDVKSAFERLGFKKPEENTWGDVAYSANMHYADYFGSTLKTEAECVRQAYADVADPDGYPGKIFNRWCADIIGKKVNVPWENFI